MGMFDRIWDPRVRCPRCGAKGSIEMQTKNIDPGYGGTMTTYVPHYKDQKGRCWGCKPFLPSVREQENHKLPRDHAHIIGAFATCGGPSCRARSRALSFLRSGSTSGEGTHFEIEYRTNDDYMIGEPRMLPDPFPTKDKYEVLPMKKLSALVARKGARATTTRVAWRRSMELSGSEPLLAILEFNPPWPRRGRRRRAR